MLDTVIAEQPVFNLRIFPALGRLFKGLTKVFAQPVRVEFVQYDGGKGLSPPSGAVYSVQPIDGEKREVYISYTDEGPLNWQHVRFVERDSSGELSRIVPEKEERVPEKWIDAIKEHLDEEREIRMAAQPFRVEFVESTENSPLSLPLGFIYAVEPLDGEKREIYAAHWRDGYSDATRSACFIERDESGKLVRLIPDKEERVPNEWRLAIDVFSATKRGRAAIRHVLG